MAQPRDDGLLPLPVEVQLLVAAFLDLRSLAATVDAGRGGLGDDAFRPWVPRDSLFRLKRPAPGAVSWRARCRERRTARRRDLAIVPGSFRFVVLAGVFFRRRRARLRGRARRGRRPIARAS